MIQYGQVESVCGTLLRVNTNHPDTVSFEVKAPSDFPLSFLIVLEVELLIEQLQIWLDQYYTGGVA